MSSTVSPNGARNADLPPVTITQNLPAAIRRQIDEAAKLYDAPTPPDGVTPQGNEPAPPAPPAAPTPQDGVTLKGNEPAPPAPPAPPLDPENIEHRIRSAQGRERAAARRAEALEAEMAQLRADLAAAKQPPAAPVGPLPDLTPDQLDALGPDIIDAINRRAAIIARGETARLQAEIESLRAGFEANNNSRILNARDQLYSDLDVQIPNWRVINTDDGFLDWLNGNERYSRQPRRVLLQTAFKDNDTETVVAIFSDYGKTVSAPQANGGVPQGQNANQPSKLPLETFAAPGRAAQSSAQQTAPEKAIWSRGDITRFYNDVSAGRFAGREAEKNSLEADLMLAQVEGRISP